MTMTVDFVDAGLAAVLDRAPAGEEILLAEDGKPYARVVKLDTAAPPVVRRQPGGWPELANIPDSVWFDPLPDDELDAWEGKYSNIL